MLRMNGTETSRLYGLRFYSQSRPSSSTFFNLNNSSCEILSQFTVLSSLHTKKFISFTLRQEYISYFFVIWNYAIRVQLYMWSEYRLCPLGGICVTSNHRIELKFVMTWRCCTWMAPKPRDDFILNHGFQAQRFATWTTSTMKSFANLQSHVSSIIFPHPPAPQETYRLYPSSGIYFIILRDPE